MRSAPPLHIFSAVPAAPAEVENGIDGRELLCARSVFAFSQSDALREFSFFFLLRAFVLSSLYTASPRVLLAQFGREKDFWIGKLVKRNVYSRFYTVWLVGYDVIRGRIGLRYYSIFIRENCNSSPDDPVIHPRKINSRALHVYMNSLTRHNARTI